MPNKRHDAPRLVPTGNVDDVLLTGKSHGKDLTLFQSFGLAVIGFCFVIGVGIPAIVHVFALEAKFRDLHLTYPRDVSGILWGGIVCVLGLIWMVLGLVGVMKARRKRDKINCR